MGLCGMCALRAPFHAPFGDAMPGIAVWCGSQGIRFENPAAFAACEAAGYCPWRSTRSARNSATSVLASVMWPSITAASALSSDSEVTSRNSS